MEEAIDTDKGALASQSRSPFGQELRAFGLMRDIRVHAQDTQRSLAEIKTALAVADPAERKKQLEVVLKRNEAAFNRHKQKFADLLKQTDDLFGQCSRLYSDYGDEASMVATLWERVADQWPSQTTPEPQLSQVLPDIEQALRAMVWHCGFVTIPPRVNEHLVNMRPGEALNFGREFIDELPEKVDRDEMLKFLRDHQALVEGIVDVEQGVIFRASRNAKIRARSFWRIAILLVLGVLVVGIICHAGDWLNLSAWPVKPDQFRALFVAYLFVLFGGLAHLGIAAYKQTRSGKEQPFTAVDDFVLWIHVKEWPIISGILLLWFGLFGMTLLGKLPDWQAAFFVGYSIDSVADVVLKRFEAAVPKQVKL